MATHDRFDSISPIDYRYSDKEVLKYLSENGFIQFCLSVELALVKALAHFGKCPPEVVEEVTAACSEVTTAEVYEEERRIGHDIRALVNCLRAKVSDRAKPFIHMTATSYDIISSANAARYRGVVNEVLVPALVQLEKVLINITFREAETVQIGRTHGQHAVPITFGFAIAGYVSRIGESIETLNTLAERLTGKFSGAVGSYNASSLFFDDPRAFEAKVLAELGLTPAEHSTQIVPPEALTRLLCEVATVAGVLANLARDMRHLQRTEIAEVGEEFEADQVGSSTMPQKRNPINFENVESMWKVVMARMQTVFMDQVSEHQRDLTNSASARTYGEIVAYTVSMVKRLTKTMKKISVDRTSLDRNLALQKGLVAAEPLYIILAALGHPDAHEAVRTLTLQAQREKLPLEEVVEKWAVERYDNLAVYINKMTPYQQDILSNPAQYRGIASERAWSVAEHWKTKLGL